MTRPVLCSISSGGLGNRLKSFWGARRLDPRAVMQWPLEWRYNDGNFDRIVGSAASFKELFDAPEALVKDINNTHAYYSWQLSSVGDEPPLDFTYNKTPSSAIKAYLPIVNSLRPAQNVLDTVRSFDQEVDLNSRTGFHIRMFEHPTPQQLSMITSFVRGQASRGLIYVSTDNHIIREISRNISNVVVYPEVGNASSIDSTALCEMLSLARCKDLIATSGSTFSECAWWFGGAIQNIAHFDPKTGCDDRHAVEYDDMII